MDELKRLKIEYEEAEKEMAKLVLEVHSLQRGLAVPQTKVLNLRLRRNSLAEELAEAEEHLEKFVEHADSPYYKLVDEHHKTSSAMRVLGEKLGGMFWRIRELEANKDKNR